MCACKNLSDLRNLRIQYNPITQKSRNRQVKISMFLTLQDVIAISFPFSSRKES